MSGPITNGEEARLSPSLHTRRLQLRMLTNEDHAPLYRLSSDPDVSGRADADPSVGTAQS